MVQVPKRAAIYCRVSTKDQDCARQQAELESFAQRSGYEVRWDRIRRTSMPPQC